MWKKFAVCVLTLAMVAGLAFAKPAQERESRAVSGELLRLVSDDFETGQSSMRTLLRLDDGREISLHGAELDGVSGGRITVFGTPIDDRNFAVTEFQQSTSSGATLLGLTSGPQNALVVLTKYTSAPLFSYGLTEIGQVIDATADFWAEDSYGEFSLLPSYVDWTSIVQTSGDELDQLYRKVVQAVDSSVDFSQIDMLIIVGDLQVAGYAGQAFRGPIPVTTDDGTRTMRVFYVESLPSFNLARTEFISKHELSHTMKLDHARILDCGDQSLAPSGCIEVNLDITNVLRPATSTLPAHHTHAAQKFQATYLDETQVTTVTETGIYTIDPLALPGPGIRAVRMATPTNDPLWIEYRQPIGLDVGLDAAAPGETNTVFDGALITRPWDEHSGQYWGSALVDADFSQGTQFDGLHYTLLPGETLEDPFSGASITTLSATPSALTVAIEIDCQDADGDGYGDNCLAGNDCDDSDPGITDSGPANVHIPAGEYLEFGDVRIDGVAYQGLDIVNTGCETLYILGVNSPDPDFDLLNKVLSVPADSTRTIWVRFTPSALGPDRSDILMQTSDSDEQWITVIAVANAVTPQELDFSPGSFSVLLPSGGQETQTLTIDNLGGAALTYWLQYHETVDWLFVDQDDELGEIAGHGRKQIALDFNAYGECTATGSVNLRLLANDDDEFETFIPVTWEVYAAPDITVRQNGTVLSPTDVIDFDDPIQHENLVITNDGCLPLTIQNITIGATQAFTVSFSGPVTVQPGTSYTQQMTFKGCPRRGGLAQCGTPMTVTTDDPDEGSLRYTLFGVGFAP